MFWLVWLAIRENAIKTMPAVAILNDKRAFAGGTIQIVVWAIPEPLPPSAHRFKYRLVYVKGQRRVVGYDNERGKGDHRHLGDLEEPYAFVDVPTLLRDFWTDVERNR
ncbi:DUF6516 family protein [Lamprobacter modestohalophilus]|uniref:toxin-antitoxin system TumE family protein n=1 Tax=Lamprobacter modestohalophilus TaxID=1064514 RepID=UPI002ADECB09|nr:DUF6516 family protein [Lamprobacter modestohalophilus]MEA1050608.1 DUF6516 family protein [Lamprobacter modestohalophilus]